MMHLTGMQNRHHETNDQCALYQETASRAEEQIRKPEGGLAHIRFPFDVRFAKGVGLSGKMRTQPGKPSPAGFRICSSPAGGWRQGNRRR